MAPVLIVASAGRLAPAGAALFCAKRSFLRVSNPKAESLGTLTDDIFV
jgi:hypothetical protein